MEIGVSVLDLLWLAGLLEGEGSFFPGAPSCPHLPVLTVQMIDRDVIERAAELLGRKPFRQKARKKHWNTTYQVRVKGERAVLWMRALRPFMGVRRQAQIDRAIASYAPKDWRVLDDERAFEALERLAAGESIRSVAERFGTSVWTMYDLRLNRSYRHLPRPAGFRGA
jgi:hypothetical protein